MIEVYVPDIAGDGSEVYPITTRGGITPLYPQEIVGTSHVYSLFAGRNIVITVRGDDGPSSRVFSVSTITGGVRADLSVIPSSSMVESPVLVGGSIAIFAGGIPHPTDQVPRPFLSPGFPVVLGDVVESTSLVFGVDVSTSVDVTTPVFGPTSQVFEPYLEFAVKLTSIASTSEVFDVEVGELDYQSILPSEVVASSHVYAPRIGGLDRVTIPSLIESTVEVFSPLANSNYRVYVPEAIGPGSFLYPIRLGSDAISPLKITRPNPNNRSFSTVDISPQQAYYSVPAGVQDEFMRRVRATSIASGYTPSVESLFSTTYYDAFYLYNPGTVTRSNIYIGINGGSRYLVESYLGERLEIHEASPFTDEDNIIRAGEARSSLFGQVNISLLVSPERELLDFNKDGSSPYLDLRLQDFSPSAQPLPVRDLGPGEFQGVYVKIETNFSPDTVISRDYAFLKLYYTNEVTSSSLNTLDRYPGQSIFLDSNSQTGGSLLPSVYFEFNTDYGKLLSEMEEYKDRLYSKYPPYFTHYEDI